MAHLRHELVEGVLDDMYAFWWAINQETIAQPAYRQIFNSSSISGSADVQNSALMNATLRETAEGADVQISDPTAGRKYVAKLRRFTAGTIIPDELLSDASKPALVNFVTEWQRAARTTLMLEQEQYYFDLFNRGGYTAGHSIFNQTSAEFEDPSGDFAFDSTELFNLTGNSRSFLKLPDGVSSNAFYNSLGATGKPLNSDNFDSAYTLMSATNSFNDEGKRIMNVPELLIAHPNNRKAAHQIVDTPMGAGVPGDTANGVNHNNGIVSLLLSPYLRDATSWFIYRNNGMWEALDQEAPEFRIWQDNKTFTTYLAMKVRYGHRIKSFHNAAGGNIPSS